MQEYRSLVFIILSIFAVTLLGAFYSSTFQEQKGWLELFFILGAVLFIFATLVIFASIGFGSFAIYGAIFLAAVMGIYGIEGALLVTSISYFIWGAIFSTEVLLLYHGLKSAQQWFEARYTYTSFKYEYKVFYPMLYITYVFLEVIPSILYKEHLMQFKPSKVLHVAQRLLVA